MSRYMLVTNERTSECNRFGYLFKYLQKKVNLKLRNLERKKSDWIQIGLKKMYWNLLKRGVETVKKRGLAPTASERVCWERLKRSYHHLFRNYCHHQRKSAPNCVCVCVRVNVRRKCVWPSERRRIVERENRTRKKKQLNVISHNMSKYVCCEQAIFILQDQNFAVPFIPINKELSFCQSAMYLQGQVFWMIRSESSGVQVVCWLEDWGRLRPRWGAFQSVGQQRRRPGVPVAMATRTLWKKNATSGKPSPSLPNPTLITQPLSISVFQVLFSIFIQE